MPNVAADPSSQNGKHAYDPRASATFERDGSAWWEVGPLAPKRYRLRLGGLFKTGWLAALCSGLARRNLSIHTAHARLAHDGSWIAELTVIPLDSTVDVMGLPYLSMAQNDEQTECDEALLDAYTLVETSDHGGTLLLELRAKDTVGLLGKLLKLGRKAGLYVIEMHIETHDEQAKDSLWLSIDGAGPLDAARTTLDALLRARLRASQ